MRYIARMTRFVVFSSLTKDCLGFRHLNVAQQWQDGRPTQLQSWRFTAYVKELKKQLLDPLLAGPEGGPHLQ